MLAAIADHLWQSAIVFGVVTLLAWLARDNFALLRVWLLRIAAIKFVFPFALLYALGEWYGFPVPYPNTDERAPDELIRAFALLKPVFSPVRAFEWTLLPTLLALAVAMAGAFACVHRIHRKLRIEQLRADEERRRCERDVDDIVARPGILKAALLTTFALAVVAVPLFGGAIDDREHRVKRLQANSLALRHAPLDMALAAPGMGARYRVNVDARGVSIRNVSIQDLVAIVYGIGHFAVTSNQRFYEGDPDHVSWLSWPRYDIRVAAPIPAPEDFSGYALRDGVTSLLAQRFGFEIYQNGKCQPPCGRYGMPPLQDEIIAAATSPVRAQLKRFLTAFNAGDRTALQKLASPRIDDLLYMHKQTGGFDVLELDQPSPTSLTGWMRARDAEALMAMTFDVQAEEPHRILRFEGDWRPPPQKYIRARLSETQATRALHAEAVYRDMTGKFSGALLVARGSKVLFRQAYGLADREHEIPNTVDTRFRTASVTKMFTAVAILRLVQDGRIALDDRIGKRLPALARQPIGRATIHQLLTHTSGAGDVFGPQYTAHQQELRSHGDYVKMFGGDALLAEPGERYEYSNLGYILLGAMIEHVTRKSYYDYVAEVVYDRAGMSRTGSLPEDVEVEGRAVGYDRPPGTQEWISAMPFIDYRGLAACGAYATVDDLARFVSALRENRLLDEKQTRLLLEPKQRIGEGRSYAYGFSIEDAPGQGTWIGHNGNDHGMNAEVWFSPATGYVVIVLSNFDPPGATQLAGFVTTRLPLP